MTEMDRDRERRAVRAVLWQWGRTDRVIADLLEQEKLAGQRMEALYSVGGARAMDGQPRSTVPGDPVFRAFESIERQRRLFGDEVEACEAAIQREQAFKAAVTQALRRLPHAQREVVKTRYGGGGHTWAYVAAMLGMSESGAKDKEAEACDQLKNLISVRKLDDFRRSGV